MKKFLGTGLIALSLLLSGSLVFASTSKINAPSSFLYQAVGKYKTGNYTGCIQDMDYLIDNGKATDIVYYYKALSYARLGISDKAKESYMKAITETKDLAIMEYSKQAITCIDNPSACSADASGKDISSFIQSNKFLHSDVENDLRKKGVDKVRTKINQDKPLTEDDFKYINENNAPTDKEIADAVRTFQKLGINPLAQNGAMNYSAYQDPTVMQMNMLLGNNTNSNDNMMNLIPFLTQMKSGQNSTNPEVNKSMVQAMMLNQMLPSFNFGSNDK